MRKFFSKTILVIFAILAVATFLRFYKLDVNPPSLFGDELDLGYQAYSILKTGRDYYGNLLPIHFHSMAEWRTPLYLYSTVPTVAIWGITPLGVRVPAALFGVLGVLAAYLLFTTLIPKKIWGLPFGVIPAALLAISPWHLQYSRAGFEATEMLFFLLTGLWLFFKSLKTPKYLWLSVTCLTLTPWVYSTAKFFTPFLIVTLFLLYRRHILSIAKPNLIKAAVAGLVVGIPIAYSTIFGGGTARFEYLSIFTDPTIQGEVGEERLQDARVRGSLVTGISPLLSDRAFHNKFVFWQKVMVRNILQSFSSEFLFIKGDPNPRQSIGTGEFYKIDAILLLLGIIFFFTRYTDKKTKWLVGFWILAGTLPAAITRDGGNHATRLILTLPPLIFLVSYGFYDLYNLLAAKKKGWLSLVYVGAIFVSFIFYQHYYWVHYTYASERWWHAGYKESFSYIASVEDNYERVFVSMAGEPAWIFLAGWTEYPPDKWQKGFPFETTWVDGFGRISFIDKYYFGSPTDNQSIYDLSKYITTRDIYLSVAKEVPPNLIMQPGNVPNGLKLLKAIPYPSGEPAYYIFTKSE
ncbi:MAG TPA: hypothetical protein VJ227_03285 [Patescibacteria group bacterium]|nr:hypothetical protein [Patescibacteria group bacterium]